MQVESSFRDAAEVMQMQNAEQGEQVQVLMQQGAGVGAEVHTRCSRGAQVQRC